MRKPLTALALLAAATLAAHAQMLSPGERGRPHNPPVMTFGDGSNSGQITIGQGIITSNTPVSGTGLPGAINIFTAWNNGSVSFDSPFTMNITNFASGVDSLLMDLKLNGTPIFRVNRGTINTDSWIVAIGPNGSFNTPHLVLSAPGNTYNIYNDGGAIRFGLYHNGVTWNISNVGSWSDGREFIGFDNNGGGTVDTSLIRDAAAHTLAVSGGVGASAFRVYNTTDGTSGVAPTNYERGVFDWTTTANTLTIGTQAGGTGSGRSVAFVAAGTTSLFSFALVSGGGKLIIDPTNSGTYTLQPGAASLRVLNSTQSNWSNFSVLNLLAGTYVSFASGAPDSTQDTYVNRQVAAVVGLGTSSANTSGWLNWGGEARTTAATNYTTNTTPAAISGLSVTLLAGRTYAVDMWIPITAGGTPGGVQITTGGTATYTTTNATFAGFSNNAVVGQSTASFNAVMGATTGYVEAHGTFTVNAGGTLVVNGSQSVSSATTTTIGAGARMIVHDMP